MTQYRQLIFTDMYGSRAVFNIITETKVSGIAKDRDALVKGVADFEEVKRDHLAVQSELAGFDAARVEAARAAGAEDKPFDKGEWKRRRADLEERAEDAGLDLQQHATRVVRLRERYDAAVAKHSEALIAEARSDAEAALRSLSTAAGMTERAASAFSNSTAIVAALHRVAEGAVFAPTPVKATPRITDQFASGTSPEVWASEAVDRLTVAIGFAERVLAEVDQTGDQVAPDDLDGLDPDIHDIPGQNEDD